MFSEAYFLLVIVTFPIPLTYAFSCTAQPEALQAIIKNLGLYSYNKSKDDINTGRVKCDSNTDAGPS